MSDIEFSLDSSMRAIADSKEAVHLLQQKQRVERAVMINDPALTLDTSKAFLETTIKTILSDCLENPELQKDMNPLYKDLRDNLILNRDDNAKVMLEKLTGGIVNWVSQLRNKYGAASHGDDGYYDNPIEMPEAEMVARLVDGVSGFLLSKNKELKNPAFAQRIYYSEFPEFNDFLDEQYPPYKLPHNDYIIPYSSFLYTYDSIVYREMLVQYKSTEEFENDTSVIENRNNEAELLSKPEIKDEHDKIFEEKYKISDDDTVLKLLINSLLINENVEKNTTLSELTKITKGIIAFVNDKAGVDWYKRESQLARLRTIARRSLVKINFDENVIADAATSIVKKAAELSENAEKISASTDN